eukprot:m.9042 g.9042  ORF g.9042 m.9042 type:complete len:687 (+) comp3349_c0_seq1:250-2310(+)
MNVDDSDMDAVDRDHEPLDPSSAKSVLQKLVRDHIAQETVNQKVKECVRDLAMEHEGSPQTLSVEEIRSKIRSKGLVNDVLQSLGVGEDSALEASKKPHSMQKIKGKKGEKFLHLTFHGGSAFIEQQGYETSTLRIHVQFRNQRFTSEEYACVCDPGFQESFLLQLPSFTDTSDTSSNTLFNIKDRIHFVVIRQNADTQRCEVIASEFVDFRPTILRSILEGRTSIRSVKVHGIGMHNSLPTGIIHMKMELIPQMQLNFDAEEIAVMMTQEKDKRVLQERQFLVHAQKWWEEYTSIRPTHKKRLVKLFAEDESGSRKPIFTYLRRVKPSRAIETPLQAARFVSLFKYLHRVNDGLDSIGSGGRNHEQWFSTHAFLSSKQGDVEDHALLLAGIMLEFGLDLYLCLGTKRCTASEDADDDVPFDDKYLLRKKLNQLERGKEEMYMWVMVPDDDGHVWFWDPVSGKRYKHWHESDSRHVGEVPSHPFMTIDCVFNETMFAANCQPSHFISECSFDFNDSREWKPLGSDIVTSVRKRYASPPLLLNPSKIDPYELAETFEIELKALIKEHRHLLGMTCRFDRTLEQTLSPSLVAYETEQSHDVLLDNNEFCLAIKKSIPKGHSFKGFPFEMRSLSVQEALHICNKSFVGKEILEIHGDQVWHAVRCRVCVFPEDVVTVWVMLACRYLNTV